MVVLLYTPAGSGEIEIQQTLTIIRESHTFNFKKSNFFVEAHAHDPSSITCERNTVRTEMAKKTKAPLAQGSPIIIAIGFFIFGSMVGFSFSRIADNSLSHCPTISNDILNDKRDHTVDNSAELTSLLKETISYMKEWKVEKSLSSHSTSSSSSSSSSSSHEVQKLQTEKQTLLKKLAEAEATTDVVAHAASPVMGSSSTLNIVSNVLTFAAPVVIRDAAKVDDNGFLTAPQSSELSHFSLDVGFNKGRVTVNDWLEKQPHLYVISVEAIPALYTLFETMMSSETQIGDGGAGAGEGDTAVPYWKLTKFHASQRKFLCTRLAD